MRFTKTFIMIGIAVAISAFYYVSEAQEDYRLLRSTLGEAHYSRCGLDKLSPAEEHELLGLITTGPALSFTQTTAVRYMEKQGWREIRVIGAVQTTDPFDEYWVIIWDKYQLYTLDPTTMPYLPDPGIYWARNSLSSWTILYPDAEEVSFSARDLD